MALAQRGFQDPAYLTRQADFAFTIAAGSGSTTGKFFAHANLLLFSLNVSTVAPGTSTYTYSGTVFVAAQQVNLIRIYNTATPGASVALATQTYGPFPVGGQFVTAGTATNQAGAYSQYQLNTSTGTGGYGGVPINQGDIFYVVTGTDATATELVNIDYQIAAGAGLTL